MSIRLPHLPGRFVIERGSIADYHQLSRFHYRSGKPATIAGVWVVRYLHGERSKTSDLAAVGVLSWPVPCVRERNLAFGLHGLKYGEKIRFANANLRTISRVIVHPVFRATGLATRLVRRMIAECPTPHVEALATMGWVHPFFDKAGMTRVDPEDASRPVYYHASNRNAPRLHRRALCLFRRGLEDPQRTRAVRYLHLDCTLAPPWLYLRCTLAPPWCTRKNRLKSA